MLRVIPIERSVTVADTLVNERPCAHLVGICGSGMSALASVMLDLGWTVTGSDLRTAHPPFAKLASRGVRIHAGHDARNLPPRADVVVYSVAIPDANPERQAARTRGIPEVSYSQMLAQLMQSRRGICIAGTHGKTTTAAMTASILMAAGHSPSACMGGELRELGSGGWAGSSDLFVVESCEYRRSFLDLTPSYAAILNVEPDHFDYFTDFQDTCAAFRQFADRISPGGVLVVNGDCAAAFDAAISSPAQIETFSLAALRNSRAIATRSRTKGEGSVGSHWHASRLQSTAEGIRFQAFRDGQFLSEFLLAVPGRHNVQNALAAIALCNALGVSLADIEHGLAVFRGVRRRFEPVGWWRGVRLVDDYAHHPTEVRACLETAREHFAGRRLWCVFQPHQVSRTRSLLAGFAESLAIAHDVLVAPVYAVRETADIQADSLASELALRIVAAGGSARFCADLDRIAATLEDETRPGDVVLTVGAGDIHRVHHDLIGHLQRNLAS